MVDLSLLAQELSNDMETKHRRYEGEWQNQNNNRVADSEGKGLVKENFPIHTLR